MIVCESTSSSAVPDDPLSVETAVTHSGPLVAGSSDLSLTCTVSETIQGLTGLPSAVWLMADTTPLTSGEDNITITNETSTGGRTVVSTLSFSPLLTSHAGLYHCQARVHSPAVAGDITQDSSHITVNVTCELSLTSGILCNPPGLI